MFDFGDLGLEMGFQRDWGNCVSEMGGFRIWRLGYFGRIWPNDDGSYLIIYLFFNFYLLFLIIIKFNYICIYVEVRFSCYINYPIDE